MKLHLAAISPQRSRAKKSELDGLLADYVERIARYYPCEVRLFASEAALFDFAQKSSARTPLHLILLDSLGKQFASTEFAAQMGKLRDSGTQQVLFAVGPADGWTPESRKQAQLLLSLGAMTLPHELARVVLAEQVYRACTILAGHPYHSGH
ncbi:MAG: 23S rRNA (pseudouridine(1915)-N(3))-methyltransferase RlmH [Acidobacteriaceae bacterium]|jgi:23S rRNA (pseudouridine1915-N3)-methyltransferase|nr:23S rRNA (pseudouridine(1915)-N(3))-methyltransferase RlmH [Acidobacteriaceae bacterium]